MIIRLMWLLAAVAIGLTVSACGSTPIDNGEATSENFHDPKSEKLFYSTGLSGGASWYQIQAIAKKQALHDVGIDNLLVVLDPVEKFTLVGVDAMGVTQDTYFVPRTDALSPDFIEGRIVREINDAAFVKASVESEVRSGIAEYIAERKFSARYYVVEDGLLLLKDLRDSGIDAVLYIKEIEIINPFSKSLIDVRIMLGSAGVVRTWQGVFYGWDVTAYAGFEVALLTTKDGNEIDRRSYRQLSAKPLPDFEWRGLFEVYSEGEKSKLVAEIQERVENNIDMALKILKIIPIEGDRFLEPSDLPATDKVRFDYPQ